jgi:hypothetical protein
VSLRRASLESDRAIRWREAMAKVTYDKRVTALLVIDPYNDFISEGGKVWDRLRTVAEAKVRRGAVEGLSALRE